MIDECSSLAAKWEQVSGFLGLQPSLIANIKGNHPNDNTGCWNDALLQWIRQNYNTRKYGTPSWNKLLKAVSKVDKRLFKELSAKHQLEGDNTRAITDEITATAESCSTVSAKGLKQHVKGLERRSFESHEMMFKFQELFSATCESLRKEEVSVSQLLTHIQCLGALKPTFKYTGETRLRHLLPALENAETCTTNKVMSAIKDYCSFFNYQMLEHIINKLGTKQDRENLNKYKEKFNEYAKCCVIECPAIFGKPNEGHTDMIVTLDDSFDDCRVSHLNIFITKLRNILRIQSDVELIMSSKPSLKTHYPATKKQI